MAERMGTITRGVDPEGDIRFLNKSIVKSTVVMLSCSSSVQDKSSSSKEEEQKEGSLFSSQGADDSVFDLESEPDYDDGSFDQQVPYYADQPLYLQRRLEMQLEQEAKDQEIAKQLQTQFDDENPPFSAPTRHQNIPSDASDETSFGKAVRFVQRLSAQHEQRTAELVAEYGADNPSRYITLVNVDDMVFLAERIFSRQKVFLAAGKTSPVDVGYHYTHRANMNNIRKDGLLSNTERIKHMVSNINGVNAALFGDGIYTANNPYSYHMFAGADHGLLVVRLKGSVEARVEDIELDPNEQLSTDTVLGRAGMSDETCVLMSGAQCLPLIEFPGDIVNVGKDNGLGNKLVYETHRQVKELIDEFFNEGESSEQVKTLKPSQVAIRQLKYISPNDALVKKVTSLSSSMIEMIYYEAPTKITATTTMTKSDSTPTLLIDTRCNPHPLLVSYQATSPIPTLASCPRSLPSLQCTSYKSSARPIFQFRCGMNFEMVLARPSRGRKKVVGWGEVFDHPSVLSKLRKTTLSHCKRCKTCAPETKTLGVGAMPTGTMRIDLIPNLVCKGHPSGTFVLSYRFEKGKQDTYHQNPAQPYSKTYRVAYVPNIPEGQHLVARLKCAFAMGLTFRIDTSETTGKSNSIVWSTIPHKTIAAAGPYGYPDLQYFTAANKELDRLGIPSAKSVPIA